MTRVQRPTSFSSSRQAIFASTYSTVHRLEIGKLRNVAKLFAHLLFTDAVDWSILADVRLSEGETTSSSRIFVKILFQVSNDNVS